MSDLRVAIVAEGKTDVIVIEAALKALLPRRFIPTALQPEPTRTKLGGWGGVLCWCLDFAKRGYSSFEDDVTLPGFDLFVVHVDADVAECAYTDLSGGIANMATQNNWPALPNNVPCPPPTGSADAMRTCLPSWAGVQSFGPRTVLCVPSKAIEAWLVAAAFEDGHAMLTNLECKLNLKGQLAAMPLPQRINKSEHQYRLHATRITQNWAVVRQRCTQAERFSIEVAAAVPL